MNYRLKLEMLKKFKTQWRFAQAINMHESDVSRVVAGRRKLSDEEKKNWAKKLSCKISEVF